MQVIGIEEPSPIVIEEKFEGEQADRKFVFEDICEDAPESKIQSVPSLLRVKLFMAAMKAAWPSLAQVLLTMVQARPAMQACTEGRRTQTARCCSQADELERCSRAERILERARCRPEQVAERRGGLGNL